MENNLKLPYRTKVKKDILNIFKFSPNRDISVKSNMFRLSQQSRNDYLKKFNRLRFFPVGIEIKMMNQMLKKCTKKKTGKEITDIRLSCNRFKMIRMYNPGII